MTPEVNMDRRQHDGYMAGANLGHWISQYGTKSHEHFRSYVTEGDIRRIAAWGMDHVRLPVDYFLFEDDAAPGHYREDGLGYIDHCLAWCKQYGINMVLDLHHAPGFFFADGDKNCLFTDPAMQKRYLAIWRFFTERYRSEGHHLAFELLNELVLNTIAPWNDLWQHAAAEIHGITPERPVIVGGNGCNSVNGLKDLVISGNPHVWYTFHMYSPMIFTHQAASWMKAGRRYTAKVEYPTAVDHHPGYYQGQVPPMEREFGVLGKAYLEKALEPAFHFIGQNQRPLYCGEYGVIFHAPLADSLAWHRDLSEILLAHGIGRAVWSYRGFNQITDDKNEVVSGELVAILSKRGIKK